MFAPVVLRILSNLGTSSCVRALAAIITISLAYSSPSLVRILIAHLAFPLILVEAGVYIKDSNFPATLSNMTLATYYFIFPNAKAQAASACTKLERISKPPSRLSPLPKRLGGSYLKPGQPSLIARCCSDESVILYCEFPRPLVFMLSCVATSAWAIFPEPFWRFHPQFTKRDELDSVFYCFHLEMASVARLVWVNSDPYANLTTFMVSVLEFQSLHPLG
jgi:hypothetical protein